MTELWWHGSGRPGEAGSRGCGLPAPGAVRVIVGGDAHGEEGDARTQRCTRAKMCAEGGVEGCVCGTHG